MTIWYRVSKLKKTNEVFPGAGGLSTAGRWNYQGRKAIYCSASIALCTLEWLANHGLSVAGFNYQRFSIDIQDDLILTFRATDLPKGWDMTPATNVTRDFAEEKLFTTDHLAIAVPSVIIPEEYNLIINPDHSAFAEIAGTIKSLGEYKAPERR